MGTGLLIALGLTALAALLDRFIFAEPFGLWTYTLGTIDGLGLAVLGLLLFIGRLFSAPKKNRPKPITNPQWCCNLACHWQCGW